MFSELPKLFDRNFAIGYVLPVTAYIAATLKLISGFELWPELIAQAQSDFAKSATIIGLATLLGGILLVALNREIIRLVEGYGRFNPARLFASMEQSRYEQMLGEISKLEREVQAFISDDKSPPLDLQVRRGQLLEQQAKRFPDRADLLLPTAFGNTIRAFEVYPRVMYGYEAIDGWFRLHAVTPKEYREFIDTAKAQTDFWLNLWLISCLVVIGYIWAAIYTLSLRELWLPLAAVSLAIVSILRARRAATEWGDWVKASFDAFLPELRKKLGLPNPATREQERELWTRFSQAAIFRLPEVLPDKDWPAEQVERTSSSEPIEETPYR